MFCKCVRALTNVNITCAPRNFVWASDLAFYFPRFRPRSHITEVSIPELKDAIDLTDPLMSSDISANTNTESSTSTLEHLQYNNKDGNKSRILSKRWSTTDCSSSSNTASENAEHSPSVTPTERALHLQRREKALILLDRVIDIYENINGGAAGSNVSVVNALRPLYAMRFELMNGNAHLPRPAYTHHIHLHKTILRQAGRLLLYNALWDKGDVNQIDTSCVIVAHFVKVFCALWQRPFNSQAIKSAKNVKSGKKQKETSDSHNVETNSDNTTTNVGNEWSLVIDEANVTYQEQQKELNSDVNIVEDGNSQNSNVLTLAIVLDRIDELIRLCKKVQLAHGAKHPQFRWSVPKLLLLKSLLIMASTGNLLMAQTLIDDAAELVFKMTAHEGSSSLITLLHGRDYEAELGLFMCAQAEMAARIFDWNNGTALEYMDSRVYELYQSASKFYAEPCNTTTDADGIMDLSEEMITSREFEVQAYASVQASYATFLLNAPRKQGTSRHDTPVFLPQQLFTFNPIQLIRVPSLYMYGNTKGHKMTLLLQKCRQQTGEALERALKLNRRVFAENERQNPQASWLLLSMACMYGDARDYLYATGLFESALKGFVENYGPFSLEVLLLQKLKYEYLAGVGSEDEAKSASHAIINLLKRMDELPVPRES